MSLFIAFHDRDRAVVCSDDLAISFNDTGEPVRSSEKASKFIVIGALIFAAVGRSDVCESLRSGTRRLLEAHPSLSVADLAQILPEMLQRKWATRQTNPNAPLMYDALETAVIGYDGRRIRSFAFTSGDAFRPVETTASDSNRIFCLGAYGPNDAPRFERLTGDMSRADGKGSGWIAAHLEGCVEDLHARSPRVIGQPSFFAGIDRHGLIALPSRFTPAPSPNLVAAAAHFVTTNKEEAFNGITRFFLGSITTPIAGGPDSVGNNDGGVTSQSGKRSVLGFALVPVLNSSTGQVTNPVDVSGTGSSITDPQASIDGDGTTASVLTSTGNGATNSTQLQCAAAPGIGSRQFLSATLNITREVPTNSIAGGAGVVYTLSYTTNGGKTFTTLETLSVGGGTLAKSTISVNLTVPFNPGLMSFHINTSALGPGMTSGSIVAKIYDANIVVTE